MCFYHVCVEYINRVKNITKYEYLCDLNNTDKILKDILTPFKNNKQVIIDGRFLSKSDILKIKVVKTEKSSEQIVDEAYRALPSNVLVNYDYTMVFSVGVGIDITTDLFDAIHIEKEDHKSNNLQQHLHERISAVSYKKYLDGYYADAVESAIKEINSRLKKLYKKFKNEELDGSDLFAKTFLDDESKTLLKVADLSTQSGKDEQKGYRMLFMGMWSALRNPKAHENSSMTEDEAYDRLIFTSLLMKKIDKAFNYTFEE